KLGRELHVAGARRAKSPPPRIQASLGAKEKLGEQFANALVLLHSLRRVNGQLRRLARWLFLEFGESIDRDARGNVGRPGGCSPLRLGVRRARVRRTRSLRARSVDKPRSRLDRSRAAGHRIGRFILAPREGLARITQREREILAVLR